MRTSANISEVGIYTFGSKVVTTNRPQVNYIIDVAGLRDPQSNRGFRRLYADGRSSEVVSYVKEDPRIPAILDTIKMLTHIHLRSQAADFKWLSFGIRDHHGTWIGPAVGEIATEALDLDGYKVNLFHYDLEVPK